MWDGRETLTGMSIREDLAHQSNGATQGHAQKPDPINDAQREEIVAFETGLFFAQTLDSARACSIAMAPAADLCR